MLYLTAIRHNSISLCEYYNQVWGRFEKWLLIIGSEAGHGIKPFGGGLFVVELILFFFRSLAYLSLYYRVADHHK